MCVLRALLIKTHDPLLQHHQTSYCTTSSFTKYVHSQSYHCPFRIQKSFLHSFPHSHKNIKNDQDRIHNCSMLFVPISSPFILLQILHPVVCQCLNPAQIYIGCLVQHTHFPPRINTAQSCSPSQFLCRGIIATKDS